MAFDRSMQLQYKGKSKSATFKQVDGVVKSINPITRKAGEYRFNNKWVSLRTPNLTGALLVVRCRAHGSQVHGPEPLRAHGDRHLGVGHDPNFQLTRAA